MYKVVFRSTGFEAEKKWVQILALTYRNNTILDNKQRNKPWRLFSRVKYRIP